MPEHTTAHAPFPIDRPEGMEDRDPRGLVYDPRIHLQLEAPAWIKPILTKETASGLKEDHPVAFPVEVRATPGGSVRSLGPGQQQQEFPGMAFTAAFRVLSDEGVRAVREVIHFNERFAKSNERSPKILRGLAYRSKFIRDFNECEHVRQHLSKMSGTPIHPHSMAMNWAQINFGKVGLDKSVDKWHLDSVPYVMVVLLSDATDMVGGRLEVARLPDAKEALRQVQGECINRDIVDVVDYPGPGYAIFMQGCAIAHAVTAVKHAREPRLTLVNSYQSGNPFADVRTAYRTFKVQDPANISPAEIGRHYAWRVQGKLEYILKQGLYGEEGKAAMLKVFDEAKEELEHVSDMIRDKKLDESPYKVDTADPGYISMMKTRDDNLKMKSKL